MSLDPVAALMVDEAGPLTGRVLVVDDVDGALTRLCSDAGADVLTWCDDLRQLDAVPPVHRLPGLMPEGWTPDLVLWRLPKALAAVEDYAEHLAGRVGEHTRVIAGGRTKHMAPSFNVALARAFAEVSASLGRQKSRVLRASGARPVPRRWPLRRYLPEVGLTVVAHGNVFNTNRLDDGTRLLVRTLARGAAPAASDEGRRPVALDVGCGSGIIATWLAVRGWDARGVDVSASAVASARLTALANRARVDVRRADMLATTRDASVVLVVSNPPFHVGAAKDSTPTLAMIADAARVLRPGGECWLVFNAHLPYLAELRRSIGVTTIEAQDRHYIVARALKDPGA